MAGEDRHNCGHEMTPSPVGPPVWLPSRLTESTVWSKDRIWPGLDSIVGRARWFPLTAAGSTYIASTGT